MVPRAVGAGTNMFTPARMGYARKPNRMQNKHLKPTLKVRNEVNPFNFFPLSTKQCHDDWYITYEFDPARHCWK